jgi:hypothetical protein
MTSGTCLERARKPISLGLSPLDFLEELAPRDRCRLNCSCTTISLIRRAPWNTRVHDISADGIRLVLGHPLPPGTFLAVSLHSILGQFIRRVRACVIRSNRMDADNWIIGCSLNPELDDNELDALLM